MGAIRSLFGIKRVGSVNLNHAGVMRLAGLTAVADWIGSMEDVFTYEPPQVSMEAYWPVALQRAEDALARAGMRPCRSTTAKGFRELFPGYEPWPLHRAAESVAANVSGPTLILIEAPMGEGKTEAALLLANTLAARLGQQGLYIGLPTRATANQMFGRVSSFLQHCVPGAPPILVLAHGEASLTEMPRLSAVYDSEGDRAGGVRAETWFLPKKRTLLAEHAVGTIDQALLGVLRTRHGFVRLFGLAGKIVVLDEVHAYDTFTSTILERLIEWLGALGATVVVLSATLPRSRRRALSGAYMRGHGVALREPEEAAYPRISTVAREACSAVNVSPRGASVSIEIRRIDTDVDRLAQEIAGSLRDGGCVGWICNTVARAQAAYAAVARIAGGVPRLLIHARMFPDDRLRRERRLEALLGPEHRGARRPERCVVVGTQVLEQSLDVDFDLLVSDLAPLDLLLQRAGRLHRHRGRKRPAAHSQARLWIARPEGAFDRVPVKEVAGVVAFPSSTRLRFEVERRAVDAIPKARRRRAVREHVAEMTAAGAAVHLRARHPVAPIDRGADGAVERREKAGPSRPALELPVRHEERLAAPRAAERAGPVLAEECARPGRLGGVPPEHGVLFGGQQPAPLLIGLRHPEPVRSHHRYSVAHSS
jgi:CRISPR-associated endonuclease/helicase Cas3